MTAATLTVNLAAIRANYRLLCEKHAKHACAAVVKANAYGLGVEAVSKTLWKEGCREFFVATLMEAVELREILPEAKIAVFNGIFKGEEKEFARHNLTPVLNDPGQAELWKDEAILHVDTGMTRLGFTETELAKFSPRPLRYVMSHLACSMNPEHPKNAEQLARFKEALKQFPGVPASLPNSSAHFMPPEYHFDLGRPGCAIYGINPVAGKNPMHHVATLAAPIIQLRELDRDEDVGYGSTYAAKKGSRMAVTALGYADGVFRNFGKNGDAYINGRKVPIAGRISMDMITLDVTDVPEAKPGMMAEFINEQQTVNGVAESTGTIGYEIFTRIGRRVKRAYV